MTGFPFFNNAQTITERFFRDMGEKFEGLDFTMGTLNHIVLEDDANFIIEIDAPGLDKESISIEIVEQVLTVKAKRKAVTTGTILWDGRTGDINKRYDITPTIGAEINDAEYNDGVLIIKIPKAVKTATTIKVK
jgi:HSP20 family protein